MVKSINNVQNVELGRSRGSLLVTFLTINFPKDAKYAERNF